jgi:hypothetical protein
MKEMRHSADFILSCQMTNGFIPMNTSDTIWGTTCFGTSSAQALLRVYQVTKDPKYLKAVLRFADWYPAHINPDGTMYDWKGTRDVPVSMHSYDSSDAYGADFIALCYETYQVTHDRAWLKAKYPAVVQCVKGVLLTWQSDGLTYAKPTYKVKYLMDNLSVHYGLRAAVNIANLLHTSDVGKWTALFEQNRAGLKKLYMPKEGHFSAALFEDGNLDTDWAKWYPDGMANASALGCILDKRDPEAVALYHQLNAKFHEDDYFQYIAVWKFGSVQEARKMLPKLAEAKQCADYSNYIRAFVPELDAFFYDDEWLVLPDLHPGK